MASKYLMKLIGMCSVLDFRGNMRLDGWQIFDNANGLIIIMIDAIKSARPQYIVANEFIPNATFQLLEHFLPCLMTLFNWLK